MADENITKMMSAMKQKNMMEQEAIEIKMELRHYLHRTHRWSIDMMGLDDKAF